MQYVSNYKNYIISTSVLALAGKPCEASFVVSRRNDGADATVIRTERLEKTFAFGTDARAAGTRAAQAYVDSLPLATG